MKVTRVGPDEIFHRYLTPKWAFLPISGAGAAIDGGRFNRPGVEALYLSRSAQTALDEYKQG
ncbi:RES domain-containing protein, partial [Mesorhizobium sp. M1E.F.Ca.ET.041.01.1.1]